MKRPQTNPSSRTQSAPRPGFALVVAISLMGFMLLLILGLSTMTQIELAAATHTKQKQIARENARLGLLVALGQLQSTAGPDQRVTARADILGDGAYAATNRYWTGVWDTTNMAAEPTWLVSGTGDPTTASSGPVLVKPSISPLDSSSTPAVRAPLVSISNGNGEEGQYAYWISGENDKIALGALEQFQQLPTDETERRYIEFQRPAPDLNFLTAAGYKSPEVDGFDLEADDTLTNRLAMAISNHQFAGMTNTDGTATFPEWRTAQHSHFATAQTWSVLADSNQGGLKKNLLDPTLTDIITNQATREFLNGYPDTPKDASIRSTFNDLQDGEPYFEPRAVPTEIVLWAGIFHTWSDAKLRIRYHVQAEFWNPYSIPLIHARDNDSKYDRAFTIRFENMPKITIRQATMGRKAPTLTENLDDFLSYNSNHWRNDINSWMEISPNGTAHRPQLEPGEVYIVTEPDPDPEEQPEGLARDFGTQRWSGNQDTRPPDEAQIEIKAEHPEGGVTIIVEDYDTGDTIFRIEGLEYDDFTIRKRFRNTSGSSADSFSRSTSSSYEMSDYTIAYHFRLDTDEADPGILAKMLEGLDPREPVLDAQGTFDDDQGNTLNVSDYITPASWDPADASQLDLNTFSLLDIHRDNHTRSHQNIESVLLYDVPREDSEFVSLGAMRFLPRWKSASMTLGSPHAEAGNELFDQYFVGDINRENPHLRLLNGVEPINGRLPITPSEIATNALVSNGFNVNSTSVESWIAFLSSRALIETGPGSDEYARNVFTRLPFYTAENPRIETNFDKIKFGELTMPPSYQQGARQLDPTKAKDQLKFIAEGIVDHLQTRGQPYASVQEFLDSGVIQDLLESPETPDGGGINVLLHDNSNVYITQSDIAAQRADQLTARSDTFLIRSYGNVINALSGEISAEAYIEAMVRRIPSISAATDSHVVATATNPREFEIVSWRWIDRSELQ